jgi:acyl-CoA dehydrogenase
MDDLFTDALGRLLADHCTPQVVREIEAGASADALWKTLDDAGFADALLPEGEGGAGLALADAFPLLLLCGRHALPLPLGETMLARALLAAGGVARPAGSIALAEGKPAADGGVACGPVSGGRVAERALVSVGDRCLLLDVRAARHTPATFPLDAALDWSSDEVAAAPRLHGSGEARLLLACIYAAQLAGASMHVFESTLRFANERVQFGRPIGKFQAIQHQLAVIAEHAFAARMAAQIGCQADGLAPDRLRVAVAKARTSEAALEVAAASHSIHGAIGFTEAFDLQLHTRRLHAWRRVGGSESYWHDVAGEALVARPALALESIRAVTDIS